MALPPLIPRSVLFGNPDHASPVVSPDGTLLGFVAPEDGVLNVWVGPVDGSRPPRAVTHDRDRGVRTFAFTHDDTHLLYLQDTGGDENWRLYLLELADDSSTLVTPGDGIQARILGHNRWNPHHVLVGLNDREPALHDVHRLDLRTGRLELVATNPGYADWLVDSDLNVRGGSTVTADGGLAVQLWAAGQPPAPQAPPFLVAGPDDAGTTGVVGFTRSGAVLVESSLGVNAGRLERHDLDSGEVRVLAEDEQYDVAGLWQDPATLEVQAVEFARERRELLVLDPALEADLKVLTALGEGELSVGRRERGDRLWTVSVSPSDGPIDFHLYDRSTATTRYLFPHREELVGQPLARMEAFSFTARDGAAVHGYLTFPPGLAREGLPAVLAVHGGPWARDAWGFDPQAQWLANRGYVCVQVNFRGSTGYGKAWTNAGDRQWGRTMQDDLTDAVAHVVAQGWVDQARVGIYGGSYGGYAVLAGAAFTPEVYRCGIDVVGPSNLLTLLDSVPEYWRPMLAMLHKRVGDPATERELLEAASPLNRAGEITIPLLIVQGANDPRVKQAEAEQIVAALAAKGLPHEYLLFPDEGHGMAKPGNRETFFARAEAFLAEHLGGRVQAPDGAPDSAR